MNDVWKKVDGYKNVEVTKDGRVRTWHSGWNRYVVKNQKDDKDGYKRVNITREDGVRTTARVHRLIAIAYIPNPYKKPQVNHINGVKYDNKVENLEWATVAENTQHGYDSLGVLSAQSAPYLLKIDGNDFSTYQSITYLSEEVGFNRNSISDEKVPTIEEISGNYFSIHQIEDAKKYSEQNSIPYNKKVWNSNNYKMNTRGVFFKVDTHYFDRVKELMDFLEMERSSIYRMIRTGRPNRKGHSVEVVSGREYLENCKHRNW